MGIPWQALVVILLLLGYVDWDRGRQRDRAVAAEIKAAQEAEARKYVKMTVEMSRDFNKQLAEKDRASRQALDEREEEINQLRLTADRLAQVDPLSFGDDYHVRLARVMCRIEAGTSAADRETCDTAAAEAYLADVAFTITVTADNAEYWGEQCEDGKRDFCDWSLTGFTPQAALTMLAYIEKVDAYALAQGQQLDGLHELISNITASPKSEGN